MLNWYSFTLHIDDLAGFTKAQALFTEMLVNSGGMSGIALFYKNSYNTKENQFYASMPETMPEMAEIVNRIYPLTPCERPTGKELTILVSGSNNQDDFAGICKKLDF